MSRSTPWIWRPYVIAPIVAVVLGLPLVALSAVSADLGLSADANCEENADEDRELLRRALGPVLPAEQEVSYRDSCPYRDGASASWSVGASSDDDVARLVAAGWTVLSIPIAPPASGRARTELGLTLDADNAVTIWLTCENGSCEGAAAPG